MKEHMGFKLSNTEDVSATHQPYLIKGIENSRGDVLELGVGMFSTDLIHHILGHTERKIVSVDDNSDWINKFVHSNSEKHQFDLVERSVDSWITAIDYYSKSRWGVVFVDQGFGEEIWRPSRNYSVQKLIDCSDFVIAHDADMFPEMRTDEYNWIECIPSVCVDSSRRGPSTYVFSKTVSKEKLINIFV